MLGVICWISAPAFLRVRSFVEFLGVLPIFAIFFGGCIWMLRFCLQGAFGTEEIVIGNGTFLWIRKSLWLTRKVEAADSDITGIAAKKYWGGWGRVDISVKQRAYSIG